MNITPLSLSVWLWGGFVLGAILIVWSLIHVPVSLKLSLKRVSSDKMFHGSTLTGREYSS